MARELSVVNRISETEAVNLIEENLAKGPRRGPKPEEQAQADGEGESEESDDENDSEEAAA